MTKGKLFLLLLTAAAGLVFWQCANRIERKSGSAEEIGAVTGDEKPEYIKLHMRNGEVYVLQGWAQDEEAGSITGTGLLLDINRKTADSGMFSIPFKDVVVAETNNISWNRGNILFAPLIVTGVIAGLCAANPKACFGSCPTFYIDNGNGYALAAEGFSSAVSPALEETDIDALTGLKPSGRIIDIKVKNEAYETHYIRRTNLLAVKRDPGNRIYADAGGRFFETGITEQPVKSLRLNSDGSIAAADLKFGKSEEPVNNAEDDIAGMLCAEDGAEWFSRADEKNLAEKEIIELTFKDRGFKKKGLILRSRQTLMTTYLFYQGLAYMGSKAGEFFANLERNPEYVKKILDVPRNIMGTIEVLIEDGEGGWIKAGETGETGPIASDITIVPLTELSRQSNDGNFKVRLRLTKGLWRLDFAALGEIIRESKFERIEPESVTPEPGSGTGELKYTSSDEERLLMVMPGETYNISYRLPKDYSMYDYFMESRGYYMEWMREEWMAEENDMKVYEMLFNSKQYFKDAAPLFKQAEAEMEESFWSSKYVLP